MTAKVPTELLIEILHLTVDGKEFLSQFGTWLEHTRLLKVDVWNKTLTVAEQQRQSLRLVCRLWRAIADGFGDVKQRCVILSQVLLHPKTTLPSSKTDVSSLALQKRLAEAEFLVIGDPSIADRVPAILSHISSRLVALHLTHPDLHVIKACIAAINAPHL